MDNRLGELLSFITGKNNLPALGFSQQPKVEFLHEGDTNEFTRGLPKAHACFNVLKLPVNPQDNQGPPGGPEQCRLYMLGHFYRLLVLGGDGDSLAH